MFIIAVFSNDTVSHIRYTTNQNNPHSCSLPH
jgi:hypothetical protein